MKMKKLKSLYYHNVSTNKFEDSLNFKINNQKRFDNQTIYPIYFDYQMI